MWPGKVYQMLRRTLDGRPGAIPELSANKYIRWVPFTVQDAATKPRPHAPTVPFHLAHRRF